MSRRGEALDLLRMGGDKVKALIDMLRGEGRKASRNFFSPGVTATWEGIPYANAGHLPGVMGKDYGDRQLFSREVLDSFATPGKGNEQMDALHAALGMKGKPIAETTGSYTPPGGVPERQPGMASTVEADFTGGEEALLNPELMRKMGITESARGYMGVQGGTPYHAPTWNPLSGNDMFSVRKEAPMRGDDMTETMKYASIVADRGRGVTAKDFEKRVETPPGGIGEETFWRGDTPGDYISYENEWAAGEGSGEATKKFLTDMVAATDDEFAKLDPVVTSIASKLRETYGRNEAAMGDARGDIMNALRILKEGGITALKMAHKNGKVPLPAIVLGALTGELDSSTDETSPAQDEF